MAFLRMILMACLTVALFTAVDSIHAGPEATAAQSGLSASDPTGIIAASGGSASGGTGVTGASGGTGASGATGSAPIVVSKEASDAAEDAVLHQAAQDMSHRISTGSKDSHYSMPPTDAQIQKQEIDAKNWEEDNADAAEEEKIKEIKEKYKNSPQFSDKGPLVKWTNKHESVLNLFVDYNFQLFGESLKVLNRDKKVVLYGISPTRWLKLNAYEFTLYKPREDGHGADKAKILAHSKMRHAGLNVFKKSFWQAVVDITLYPDVENGFMEKEEWVLEKFWEGFFKKGRWELYKKGEKETPETHMVISRQYSAEYRELCVPGGSNYTDRKSSNLVCKERLVQMFPNHKFFTHAWNIEIHSRRIRPSLALLTLFAINREINVQKSLRGGGGGCSTCGGSKSRFAHTSAEKARFIHSHHGGKTHWMPGYTPPLYPRPFYPHPYWNPYGPFPGHYDPYGYPIPVSGVPSSTPLPLSQRFKKAKSSAMNFFRIDARA